MKHQHVLSLTHSLLFKSHLPKHFWAHSLSHIVFLINRLPSKFLQFQTPFQILHQSFPYYSNIKVFLLLVFSSKSNHNRIKLDPRSHKYIYLGNKHSVKRYILRDLQASIFLFRDTLFSLNSSHYPTTNNNNTNTHIPPPINNTDHIQTYLGHPCT